MATFLRMRSTCLLAIVLSGCGSTLYDATHVPITIPVCTSDAEPIACSGAPACVAEDDSHCGSSCADCAAEPVQHGTSFCDRTSADLSQHACATSCEPGFVRDPAGPGCACDVGEVACGAGGSCVAETVSSCGATCQACAAPAGATPTCSNHVCDYICPGGQVQCTNASGQADCCIPACGTQQILCGVACVQESATQCGSHCVDCRDPSNVVPANASAACLGPPSQGVCTFACDAGFLKSRGACVQVAAGPGSVALGASHACVLTTAGGVMCWGNNGSGQLGVGDTVDRLAPVDVTLAGGAVAKFLSAGVGHTCAVTTAGGVQCWGSNSTAQLGQPQSTALSAVPIAVPGLASVSAVAAGAGHTCALLADGTVRCWGANDKAQAGANPATTPVVAAPTAVNVAGPISQVVTQLDHTCVLNGTTGQVSCWGSNLFGQTGQSASPNPSLPGAVVSGLVASAVAVGGTHTCALGSINLGAQGVYCWGDRSAAQLGDGLTAPNSNVPTLASRIAPAVGPADRILAGRAHSCDARAADGLVTCAGANLSLQVGRAPPSSSEAQGPAIALGPIDGLFGGGDRSCALAAGVLRCWGANDHGQLGDGSTVESAAPVAPRPF